jgi:hypothetical protein
LQKGAYSLIIDKLPNIGKVLFWLLRQLKWDIGGLWEMGVKFDFERIFGLDLPHWQSSSGSFIVCIIKKLRLCLKYEWRGN